MMAQWPSAIHGLTRLPTWSPVAASHSSADENGAVRRAVSRMTSQSASRQGGGSVGGSSSGDAVGSDGGKGGGVPLTGTGSPPRPPDP